MENKSLYDISWKVNWKKDPFENKDYCIVNTESYKNYIWKYENL